MFEEAHLVDGNLNYIGLVEGVVDHYVCWECGASMELQGVSGNERVAAC